jgi:hypothetical protein
MGTPTAARNAEQRAIADELPSAAMTQTNVIRRGKALTYVN